MEPYAVPTVHPRKSVAAFDQLSSGFILWPDRGSTRKREERYHIVILRQVELHVSGEPVLVSRRVRQAVPGCTKQKHGTGSGGSADQQR